MLVYYLTLKEAPNAELQTLLEQFESEVYKQVFNRPEHEYPLLYMLVKLYASKNHRQLLEKHVMEFKRVRPVERHSM